MRKSLLGRSVYGLNRDYLDALARAETEELEAALLERLRAYRRFIERHAHALSPHPNTLLPLAHAQPKDNPVGRDARSGRFPEPLGRRPWFRRMHVRDNEHSPVLRMITLGSAVKSIFVFRRLGQLCALAGCENSTVCLFDIETGSRLREYRVQFGPVQALAVLPDGCHALFGAEEGMVRLWDLESGNCVGALQKHMGRVQALAILPEGRQALSASDDRTVRLWDVTSGDCLRIFEHDSPVKTLALLPQARSIVSGTENGKISLWSLGSGECLRTLQEPNGGVRAIVVLGEDMRVLSGADSGSLRVWDMEEGSCLRILSEQGAGVWSLSVLAEGRQALSGIDDGSLRLWDLNSAVCLHTFEGHLGRISALAVLPGCRLALSGAGDHTLRLWDLDHTTHSSGVEKHAGRINGLAVVADGRRVVSGSADGTLRLWDLETGCCLKTFVGWGAAVTSLLPFSKNHVLFGCADGCVWLFDHEADEVILTLAGHDRGVSALAVIDDCSILCGAGDGYVHWWWSLEYADSYKPFSAGPRRIRSVAALPGGRHAVLDSEVGSGLALWNFTRGERLRSLSGHRGLVNALAVLPDGRRVLSGADDGTLRLWYLGSTQSLHNLEDNLLEESLGPGLWASALGAENDRTRQFKPVEEIQCVRLLEGHTDRVLALALLPDSRRAISGSCDCTLRLWDLESGSCLAVFPFDHAVSSVAFSALFSCAIVGLADGSVDFFHLEGLLA